MKKRSSLFGGFLPRFLFALIALLASRGISSAQTEVGLKTNLLYDATATANLGLEVQTAPRWTLELSGNINAWTINEHKWKHWLVQPEARYWFCEAFSGHFIGAHLLGGQFNVGNVDLDFKFLGTDYSLLHDNRYQGWGIGAGIAYGYDWVLNRHWNLEAEIGIGYIYTRSDKYPCATCGKVLKENISHNYYGLTKVALNLVYIF